MDPEFLKQYLESIPASVERYFDRLRRDQPQAWLEFATALRKFGPYDRKEQMQERVEMRTEMLESIMELYRQHIPKMVEVELQAIETHFIRHGQQLDELLRKNPARDLSPKDAVEELLRGMKMRWRSDADRS